MFEYTQGDVCSCLNGAYKLILKKCGFVSQVLGPEGAAEVAMSAVQASPSAQQAILGTFELALRADSQILASVRPDLMSDMEL